jgi:hypothetical protein
MIMVSLRYNSKMQMSNGRNRSGIGEIRHVIPREVVAWRSSLSEGVRRGNGG